MGIAEVTERVSELVKHAGSVMATAVPLTPTRSCLRLRSRVYHCILSSSILKPFSGPVMWVSKFKKKKKVVERWPTQNTSMSEPPRTWECDYLERGSAKVTSWRNLRWDHPGFPTWAVNPMACVLIKDTREDSHLVEEAMWPWRQRWGNAARGHTWTPQMLEEAGKDYF